MNKQNTFIEISDKIGIDNLSKFLSSIYTYAKSNFEKFCALFGALTIIISWIIKSIGFCYQAGKFSIYNISNTYIDIGDNFFYQLIEYISITIVFLLINFLFIFVSIQDDGSKYNFRRKRNIFLLLISESFCLFFIVLISSNSNLLSALNELVHLNLISIIAILILMLITICVINIIGIEFTMAYRSEKKKKKNGDNETNNSTLEKSNSHIFYIISGFIVVAIFILFSYLGGKIEESQRTSFKIIQDELNSEQLQSMENSNYVFYDDNSSAYILYPIIFENEDTYIVARLFKTNQSTTIDYSYQKIISKTDVQTFYIENIHTIKSNK